MELSILLARQIFSMMLMLVAGFAVMKAGLLPENSGKAISALVLYIFCPAILVSAFRMECSMQKLGSLLIGTVAALAAFFLFLGLGRLSQWAFHLDETDRLSLAYPNAGNLIVPLISAVLGSEYVFYSCSYLAVMSVLMWVHADRVISGQKDPGIKKILLNPSILAIAAGLFLFVSSLPFPVLMWTTVERIGDAVGPASMISIGILMSEMDLRQIFASKKAYLISFLRLLLFPLVFILLICLIDPERFFPGAGNIMIATVLTASAPTAVLVPQLAALHGKDATGASAANVLSTLLCTLTMPVMMLIYQRLYLS